MRRVGVLVLTLTIAALAIAAPAHARTTTRVVGGQPAAMPDMPWVVYLEADVGKGDAWSCGGTIVGAHFVLTAAHCVINKGLVVSAADLRGVAGRADLNAGDGVEFRVTRIAIHPRYQRSRAVEGGPYDAALLQIDVDLPYTPLALATEGESLFTAPGVMARIAGWGLITTAGASTDVLMTATLPLVSPAECAAADDITLAEAMTMVCAGYPEGGIDSCQGDSGGPLTVTLGAETPDPADDRQLLAGIVSWGYQCAAAGRPGLYTRAASLIGWITPLLAGDERAWTAVADQVPPRVRLRLVRAKAGKKTRLVYRVIGESGRTRETVTVRRSRAGTVLRQLRTVPAVNRAGTDSFVPWTVPAGFAGRYVWCVTSRDDTGNRSDLVCAPLIVG